MIPSFLHKYFWDVEAEKLDSKKRSPFIIERILEYGDIQAVRWMHELYAKEEIIAVVKQSRALTRKSAHFWALFLAFLNQK